jgi:amidase
VQPALGLPGVPETTVADLLFRPVVELAAMVRGGEVSARELVQASLDRIDALDPQLNAFVDVFADEALDAADAIGPGDDRPFAGVPIAIKNNRPIAGKRLTCGSAFMGDHIPAYDHNVVRRLRTAGFVTVGTTTLPEWGLLPVTEGRYLGPTRNPWDLTRTPGGSSGGSGAAVAAGMVPIGHGNDGGGSTRIPAACCGLVGLKPQRGRISGAPEVGHSFLAADGVLTRTVADTAAVLDVLAGYELGDLTWAPPPAETFATSAARDPGRLRVAVTTVPAFGDDVDPVCGQAALDAGQVLQELGHDVVDVNDPPWRDAGGLFDTFKNVFGPMTCTTIAWAARLAGRDPGPGDIEPLSMELWEECNALNSVATLRAELRLHGLARAVVRWVARYDAVLTPALAEAPVAVGEIDSSAEDPLSIFRRSGSFTPYTSVFNITGSPAVSLPLYHREDGLPLAVQLVGQPAAEGALLALAAQLEQAHPWAARRPPVS